MAIREGLRRIRVVGATLLVVGLLLDAVLAVGAVLATTFALRVPILGVGFFGIPLTLLGATILLVAWVADGFRRRRPPARSQRAQSSRIPPIN